MRLIQPSLMLTFILAVLQLLPGIYILVFEDYEYLYGAINGSYESSAQSYVWACFGFLLFVLVGRFIIPLNKIKAISLTKKIIVGDYRERIYNFAKMMGIISTILVLYYVFDGGYKKFLAIGTDMDAWEFRLIGFEDRPRYLIALLEIARRFVLPLSLLYLITIKVFYKINVFKLILFLIAIQLVAAFMTLDRAPFFTLFVVVLFPYLFSGWGIFKFIKVFAFILTMMVLIGGLITNLQYNILEFSFIDMVFMGFDFILHRFLLVPSIAPIELSFSMFPINSEKLWLEYSRLKGLIGADVVGTSDYESIYVAPVGAVGDIWRNFGSFGVGVFGLILGMALKLVDLDGDKTPFPVVVVQYFLVFALAFYYVMGVFFSQGALFALVLCMVHIPAMKIILKIKV
jgi:hypothetical protein